MNRSGRLKVVQISSVHPSFDTRIFHKICKSLVGGGFDVDLIIQHPNDEKIDGVNIISLPVAKKKSDRLIKVIPALVLKCIKYPPDTVFHFHDPELIPLGMFLKFVGYKVIYDVHEDVPEDIKSKKWIPAFLRSTLSYLVNKMEVAGKNFFDHTVVVTSKIKERLDSDRTVLIQNFPILSDKEPIDAEFRGRNAVFYLGDITRIRGLFEDIKAVEIANNESGIELIMGGKFSPLELRNELEEMPGWKYVNFVGWIPREEFNDHAERSFAGLVTFHPEPNHIDAQPNKLFEYMYAGLPVIASDFPLWRNIVKANKCGILVDPLDPEDIANAILSLKKDPDLAMGMGKNGRRAVIRQYNWANEEEKLLQAYRNLLGA
ncbi:glycosyltransferase family 4 protein [Balneola sp. MJW-20]|uniref:glycosyltransferase family 4 protein n=1 Tax=Gracilimonas aurantiaca TaxID=3234185 RepID=UPI0034664058